MVYPRAEPPRVLTRARSRRQARLRRTASLGVLSLGLILVFSVQLSRPVPPPALRLQVASSVVLPGSPPPIPWPRAGQAALAVPRAGVLLASGSETPVPVASLTKMMTAYVVLRDHPLAGSSQGPSVTITPADVADDYADERQDETSIPISTGEQLTERQLLEGLLVHSANDLADVLARYDAGSIGAFVERMNRAAASLGLHGTRYVDPSGFDPGSVSTARDLLRLASVDMRIPAFAAIVAMPSVSLPEAGQVMNYVQAVGTDGIVGVKSGFTAAAEGCVVLAARRYVGSVPVLVLAAVTGQAGYDALLKASQSALAIIDAAASGLLATPVLPEGRQAGVLEAPWASPRRYAGVVTGSAAVVLGWPGQPVSIQVEPRDLRRVRRGSVVATAVVRLGAEDEVVPLRATRSVRSPSLGWRVLRG